jgi:ABC-type transporter Mla maintaining outer membrane lipid asymmetry ATPase subunit MlaF
VRGLVNLFGSQTVHDGIDLDVMLGEVLGVVWFGEWQIGSAADHHWA